MADRRNLLNPTHRLETLTAAYQLRHHFGWYAFQRDSLFAPEEIQSTIRRTISEVATRYGYHVLVLELEPNAIRCLMSLVPANCPSEVTRVIKGNLSSQLRHLVPGKVWSRGWFVRSNGNVCRETVEGYVAKQREHHREIPTRVKSQFCVKSYSSHLDQDIIRTGQHAAFQNSYHFVFCVCGRRELVDAVVGNELQKYWLQFMSQAGWSCSELSILRDHVHLAVSLPLDVSPEAVAFRMLNNAEYWFAKRWNAELESANVESLFQSSYYVGTYGEASTAQIAAYLSNLNDPS